MKLLHLADLHFGKTLHKLSLIESGDQQYWVDRILKLIAEEKPDAVLIAGDVYDRGVPAKEAIPLLSRLLSGITDSGIPVLMVAGNHDGAERLEFAADILKKNSIHIAGITRAEMQHVTIDSGDGMGPVTFWLMPYTFPTAIKEALGISAETSLSYTEAVSRYIKAQDIDFSRRNVLIAHQTVLYGNTKPEKGASETDIGGVGGIDVSVFEGFDYVALGHIHNSQKMGSDRVQYAGSPLCYHFDEAEQTKGALMVTLGAKDEMPETKRVQIEPMHRVRPAMRGLLEDIIREEEASTATGDYVRVILTDDRVLPGTKDKLENLFQRHGCYLLDVSRDFPFRTCAGGTAGERHNEELPLDEYFLEFYRKQTDEVDPPAEEFDLILRAASNVGRGLEQDVESMAKKLVEFALKQEDKHR